MKTIELWKDRESCVLSDAICVFLSVHDNLLSWEESWCWEKHGVKVITLKKCFSGNYSWTIWILKMMKTKGRDSTDIYFILIKALLRLYFHLFSPCGVTLGNVLNTFNQQFLICKMEVIMVFTSNVISRT